MAKAKHTQRRKANRWQPDRRETKRNPSERRNDSRALFKHSIKQYIVVILVLAVFGFWISDIMKEMGATSQVVQGTLRKGGPSSSATSFSPQRKLVSVQAEADKK